MSDRVQLTSREVFSRSLLWDLQRSYFEERGVEAWREGEVPHYVTSNPTMANAYAELTFALRTDELRLSAALGSAGDAAPEPFYLCELGGGSGRFAFHFLSRLRRLCEDSDVPLTDFRYVLTDLAQSNIDFWLGHPGFEPFFESDVLDVAQFDVTETDELHLQRSGTIVRRGDLRHPIVVIANYLFDSVPQDLFHFDDGQSQSVLVSLSVDAAHRALDMAGLLAEVQCEYEYLPGDAPPYEDALLNELLAEYARTLTDMHMLFPAEGIRCLQRLGALSARGLMLLSADKGDHRLAAQEHRAAPGLVQHGSFSLDVNYHALKRFCELSDGVALFPRTRYMSVNIACLLMMPDAPAHIETRRAYERNIRDHSPDDFFTATKHARRHIDDMSLQELLALLRLALHDAHLFELCIPRLMALAPEIDGEREAVLEAIDAVWDAYFPLGESSDLANQIGQLLYRLDEYERAIVYFERSMAVYGQDTGTLYNLAVCRELLGQHGRAHELADLLLKHDPTNLPARALLARAAIAPG